MEDLGAFLRSQREAKNVSIEELAVRTRIAVRFIKAIEESQFEQLPNQVSAKGFLRSYARFLELEEDGILQRYMEATQTAPAPPAASPEEKAPSYIQVKRPDRLPFPVWAVVTVGGIILALLIFVLWAPRARVAPGPATPLPAAVVPDAPKPPADQAVPIQKEEAPSEMIAPDVAAAPPKEPKPQEVSLPTGPLILSIEAIEPSWVLVVIDGADKKEALLQPNQKIRWQAKDKFQLTLGNAGGVHLSLDGRDLDPLGPSGKVVKDILLTR